MVAVVDCLLVVDCLVVVVVDLLLLDIVECLLLLVVYLLFVIVVVVVVVILAFELHSWNTVDGNLQTTINSWLLLLLCFPCLCCYSFVGVKIFAFTVSQQSQQQ